MAALLGMLMGIGSGIARDVLVMETPQVVRLEPYAVAAVTGAGAVVAGHGLGLSYRVSAAIEGALSFGLRFMAIRYMWYLPAACSSARRRAGSDFPSDEEGRRGDRQGVELA